MKKIRAAIAGTAAGTVNGLFGAAGGMVLIPLLQWSGIGEQQLFPCSVAIMLPICITSLILSLIQQTIPWHTAFPYLIGSSVGGAIAAVFGQKIPTKWLHRLFGIMIIWGGIRNLC